MSTIPGPLQRSIVIDPFFDSDGSGVRYAPIQARSQPNGVLGTAPYRPVGQDELSNGQQLSQVMRPAHGGLNGTVIPRATTGGIPAGTRPHAVREHQVNIDPHIEGQSSVLVLGDATAENLRRAGQMAAEITPEPVDIATQRLRGAATMHGVAALGHHRGERPAGPAPSSTIVAPHLGQQGQQQRIVRPLQAFNQPSAVETNGRELRQLDLQTPPSAAMGQPQVEVTFELENFGTHTGVYHDVIATPAFVVLIYKTAYRGSKYFPQVSSENAPAMALNITGRPEVYLVQTTGVVYSYEGAEHCLLLVDRMTALPPSE